MLIFILNGCSETTFLINSAKRIGTWGEDSKYKIGNPYKINGKWYYPAVDYEYDETGLASWYGPQFHGKKTANGEIFDQNKISAAHKTLPLPSIVKVTNLENGRVLSDIRINDRGPFARGRIIDLSKKAAEELGFLNKGIARVRVQILEDESRKFAINQTNIKQKIGSAEVGEVKKEKLNDSFSNENKTTTNDDLKLADINIDFPDDSKKEVFNNEKKEIEIKFAEIDQITHPEKKEKKSDEIYFPKSSKKKIIENEEIYFSKNENLETTNLEIQVGAFSDHRNAKSLIKKLSEFEAYIKREFVNEKYLYKVRIGPVANIKKANNIKNRLNSLGFSTISLIMN